MKTSNFLILSLVLFQITSCQNDSESIIASSETPQTSSLQRANGNKQQFLGSLGANLVSTSEYESYPKIDLNAFTLSTVGLSEDAVKAALPAAYSIPSNPQALPRDQGREGSCVAWATAYAALSLLEYNKKNINDPRSPEYVYNTVKLTTDCSEGIGINKALTLLQNEGVCSWNEMPHDGNNCTTKPNTAQKNAASTHKIQKSPVVDKRRINDVKALLTLNQPVIIGIKVDSSFDNLASSNWVWSSHSGSVRGGHAVTIVGYDNSKNAFKAQNSWGANWGQGGYFWITYDFFKQLQGGAVEECYTIQLT